MKKQEKKIKEIPAPGKNPEIHPDAISEIPLIEEDDPEIIPDEDPYLTPPYEVPEPGEAP